MTYALKNLEYVLNYIDKDETIKKRQRKARKSAVDVHYRVARAKERGENQQDVADDMKKKASYISNKNQIGKYIWKLVAAELESSYNNRKIEHLEEKIRLLKEKIELLEENNDFSEEYKPKILYMIDLEKYPNGVAELELALASC